MGVKKTDQSVKRALLYGIVSGVGWAIGATFVFAIGLALLGLVLSFLGQVPVVGGLFKSVAEIVIQSEDPRPSVVEQDLERL